MGDAGDQVHHAGTGPDQVREGALGQRAEDHRRVHHPGAVPDQVHHAGTVPRAESSAKDSAEKLYWDCGDLGYVSTNGEALIAYRYELKPFRVIRKEFRRSTFELAWAQASGWLGAAVLQGLD